MKSSLLSGKTALVTGSTSGIGLGIARSLAEQGANIVFNGFGDAQQIEKLYTDIGAEFGVQTAYHNADMSRPDEIAAMMQYAQDKFGGVDVLVNNAGIQHVASVEDFPTEKWDAIIAINLSSAFHTTRLALKQVDDRAARDGIDNDAARKGLLSEKQPSGEFVTPDELGALAVFFCSPAADQVRGVAWNMDGGWAAQ